MRHNFITLLPIPLQFMQDNYFVRFILQNSAETIVFIQKKKIENAENEFWLPGEQTRPEYEIIFFYFTYFKVRQTDQQPFE